MSTVTVRPPTPVVVSARLDPQLSRWLWLVKWLLAVPHYVVLAGLWVAFVLASLAAFVAILVTGRYPRPLFSFTSGVLRWSWRVAYYAYGALGTDRYPPFSLADDPDYPARLLVAYPEHLSRGLVLVKWWLLAVPHYLVLGAFLGGGVWAASRDSQAGAGGGLLGVLVLVAGVLLLFTGRYPAGVFDLVLGIDRWVLRVAAYAGLLTDSYPPFRLDLGGEDPAVLVHPEPERPVTGGPGGGGDSGAGGGAVALLVVGALLLPLGLGLLGTGGAALYADRELRRDGFVSSPTVGLRSDTAALVSEPVEADLRGPRFAYLQDLLGEVRVTVRSTDPSVPLFLGVGPGSRVEPWVAGFRHDRVQSLGDRGDLRTEGSGTLTGTPAAAGVWTASRSGTGELTLVLPSVERSWTAVVARADGRTGLSVRTRVGATLPRLDELAAGLLVGGLLLLVAGGLLVALGATRSRRHGGVAPTSAPGPYA